MGGRGGASHSKSSMSGGVFGREPDFNGYYDPHSIQEAVDMHLNRGTFSQAIWDSLTGEQRSAIYDYTDMFYRDMNKVLFGRNPATSSIQEKIDQATQGMSRFRTPFSFVATRGDSPEDIASLLGGSLAQLSNPAFLKRSIGKTIEFKGFMSSAIHKDYAWTHKGVTTVIKVPKGTAGLYVDPVSANSGEREFLFQRGTRFKVQKIVRSASGKLDKIYLEVVP